MSKINVSLTTIPSRIENINQCLDSLINQTVQPDCIYLNIPWKYHRFDEQISIKQINNLRDRFGSILKIIRCNDYGPGTKLMGSYKLLEPNSLIILVDDDLIYKNYMIETINNNFLRDSKKSYCFYTYKFNNITIGCGCDGFALNTNFLYKLDSFYNYIMNDKYLFFHDDFWISFYLNLISVEIISLNRQLRPNDFPWVYQVYNDSNALKRLKNEFNRLNLQEYCISYYNKNHSELKNHLDL